ncbi:MAG: hypothetical protein JXQ65_14990 [Candidatus Marinimicrobia bacterium]|nr:hypothetical protein [Candidatus Neomarinimicrobiota bacterium]
MKKLIIKILFYFLLLFTIIIISIGISSHIVKKRHFKNFETESNLLVMQKNHQYDMLIMGISHARNFTRYHNHEIIEKILDQDILNIGRGKGKCGSREQLFYLDYFYHENNHARQLVYVISPPLFFSDALPVASNTFDKEPFELDFIIRYLHFKSENKFQRIVSYLQTKLRPSWFIHHPSSQKSMDIKLDKIDPVAVEKGQNYAYDSPTLKMENFDFNAATIEETIDLALSQKSEVFLIITPALFGKWRGHEFVDEFGKKMALKDGVQYYDFSESILEPEYYFDHHHLNTAGVIFFTEHYLKPVLQIQE